MNKIPAFLKVDSTTCEIKRLTPDVDHEMGSPAGTFETIATGVICSLDRSMSSNRQYGQGRETSMQGETNQAVFKLLTLSTEDILIDDKVIVAGVEYKVDDVIPYVTHKEAMLSK